MSNSFCFLFLVSKIRISFISFLERNVAGLFLYVADFDDFVFGFDSIYGRRAVNLSSKSGVRINLVDSCRGFGALGAFRCLLLLVSKRAVGFIGHARLNFLVFNFFIAYTGFPVYSLCYFFFRSSIRIPSAVLNCASYDLLFTVLRIRVIFDFFIFQVRISCVRRLGFCYLFFYGCQIIRLEKCGRRISILNLMHRYRNNVFRQVKRRIFRAHFLNGVYNRFVNLRLNNLHRIAACWF